MTPLFQFCHLSFLIGVLCLISCTTEPLPQTNIPSQVLNLPRESYGGVTWPPNGRIVVALDWELYELKDNELVLMVLESEQNDCWLVRYVSPNVLPDGRLGVVRDCNLEQGGREHRLDLIAFDWQDNSLEILTPNVNFGRFSWHPDMTRGVQSIGSLNGTIQWLTSKGTKPIDLFLNSGDKTWSLATNYYSIQNPQIDTRETGIARSATWSPNGSQIAFFATSDPVNQGGIARARGEYSLYLMNPDTLEVHEELNNIYFANVMDWSPNGEWLAFGGTAGSPRRDGLWLYSPSLNELRPVIFDVNVGDFDWSSDGQQIIAIVCDKICDESLSSGGGIQSQIVIYDVSSMLQ